MFKKIKETLRERKEQRAEGKRIYHETFEKEFAKQRETRIRETATKRAREQAKESASRYGKPFGLSVPKELSHGMKNFALNTERQASNPFGRSSGNDPFGMGSNPFGQSDRKKTPRRKHHATASRSGKQIVIKL